MASLIDIIGSLIIRGAIILAVMNLTVQMNKELYKRTASTSLRQNSVIAAQILNDDLFLAGYQASNSFPIAKPEEVDFYSDINNDGSPDEIHYYLETGSSGTPRALYRSVSCVNGGTPQRIARNVTTMAFEFFNIDGVKKAAGINVAGIRSIRVAFAIQTDSLLATDHPRKTFWEKNIFPPNLAP